MTCARIAATAFAVTGFLFGISGESAVGAVVYSYGTSAVAPSYAPGAEITLDVFLVETLTSSPSVIAADGGLDGAAFKVVRSDGTATIDRVGFNPAFDAAAPFEASVVTPTSATVTDSTAFGSPGVGLSGDRVWVGSVTFIAPATTGTTSTFDLQRFNSSGGNTVTRLGKDLDKDSSSPAYTGATGITTITINTVPEPTAAALLLLGLPYLAMRRRAR
jgi:hypothetical protein